MSDTVKTASHPFAKRNPLFRHAYCKGIILSILANKALPKATRMRPRRRACSSAKRL